MGDERVAVTRLDHGRHLRLTRPACDCGEDKSETYL